ncbi:MAG: acyl-homoserine-lactone synthase [Pseudomonadota bacterium]
MIRYIYAADLHRFPHLARTMFEDRARQFKDRLNWSVTVDDSGAERDEYDAPELNPLYILWENEEGGHGGSMRILPTTGATMVADHFSHLTDGVTITSPLVWECTRFCISPEVANGHQVASALMLAGCHLGVEFGLSDSIGVFDARMVRIYRRLGWEPQVLGTDHSADGDISVGLWPITEAARLQLLARSGFGLSDVEGWFDASFRAALPLAAIAA